MKFEIKNSFTGSVQFTAEIECDDDAGYGFKLGLAVKAAVKSRADLSRADLSRAYLSGADLSRADLSRAYLSGADLSRADLSRAYLSGADLSRADLSRAYLSGADLSGAYLSGAYLSGADLSRADLSRADLSRAYLSGAYLSGARGVAGELSTSLMMLLDQPGAIRAYKLVNEVDEGHVNGGLKYIVGETVSVDDADTDPTEQCGAGINVATLDWCLREWCPGYRVLLVEFTAADIAAIPLASDGKFRLHRCTVIAEKVLDYAALGLVKAEQKEAA